MRSSLKLGTLFLAIIAFSLLQIDSYAGGKGGIARDDIERFQESFKPDPATRAVMNAVTNNDVKKLALNREMLTAHNNLFNHRIKTKGITNQKSSGRCWLFAGLNIMRPKVIKELKLNDFEFSQNYLFFWDKMEKANTFLEGIIETRDRDPMDRELQILLKSPFPDGGYWFYVVDLIDKYGVVPKSIMPETENSENTGMMDRLICRKLRQDAALLRRMSDQGTSTKKLRAKKKEMLEEIYKLLVINLGTPPTEFEWRYEDRDTVVSELRTYTPQSFFKEVVNMNLKDYVSLFNCPTRPTGKLYQIRMTRNVYDREDMTFINIKNERLKEYTLHSVLSDDPVWFGCDVGKEDSYEHGIMSPGIYDYESLYGVDFHLTKEERILYWDSVPTHAMVFIGVDTLQGRPLKWLVENSWGTGRGDDGLWTMYDQWFDQYVYNVIIHHKYLPKEVLAILKTRPEVLPPWDPMYSIIK
ncbi:MAG: aminopeptidase C [Candidatus Zixiibacteriota bacterium]